MNHNALYQVMTKYYNGLGALRRELNILRAQCPEEAPAINRVLDSLLAVNNHLDTACVNMAMLAAKLGKSTSDKM